MADSPLDRILGRRTPADSEADTPPGSETEVGHGCFGWLRGIRDRAIMLELRKKTGHVKGFGYAWLESAEYDPSDGITLYFPGHVVRIRGKNLNAASADRTLAGLFGGILRHRVPWAQELESGARMAGPIDSHATTIEVIEW